MRKGQIVLDIVHSQLNLANLPNWDSWGSHLTTVSLNAGLNTIAIQYDPTDTAFFNLDYIEVFPGTLIPLSNPGFEDGWLSGWTEWHPYGQRPVTAWIPTMCITAVTSFTFGVNPLISKAPTRL